MTRILQKQQSTQGFSLIELMIAVAIVGILAAIAYPSYNDYILRSHRTEGKAMLTQAQANQERYFTSNNTYASTATILGYTDAKSENGYYELSVVTAIGTCPITSCYAMTVTAQTPQQSKDTHCTTMTLTSTGRKSATNDDCWQK